MKTAKTTDFWISQGVCLGMADIGCGGRARG
jgi:hypothetical protein